MTGLSEAAIRKYLMGTSEPTLSNLVKISEAAKVSLTWLATGKGSMRSVTGVAEDSAASAAGEHALPGFTPVTDKDLARMLAWLYDEWQAATERERGRIAERFERTFPDFVERGANIRRIVAALSWLVLQPANSKPAAETN